MVVVDAFKEPNRPVTARCHNCGFKILGPLLRVLIETGFPCPKCGVLGAFIISDRKEG